ncbi:hypothetical protein Tco_1473415 [Tanacetum coccineum]
MLVLSGILYTQLCCLKGSLKDKILVPKPPRNCARCAKCGTPIDGPYCQGCALLRKEFMEGLLTNCVENEFFKDFQDTSESSDDNTNDLVDQAIQRRKEEKRIAKNNGLEIDLGIFPNATMRRRQYHLHSPRRFTNQGPDNSLKWGTEQSLTLSETESDEFIKSSVEDPLSPIPKWMSRGIPDSMCDVPLCNNPTSLEAFKEHSEIVVNSYDDNSSSDDDSPYDENIDYVDASSPDVEIVSLEVVEIVDPEVGRIDDDNSLTIKRHTFSRKRLLNVNVYC